MKNCPVCGDELTPDHMHDMRGLPTSVANVLQEKKPSLTEDAEVCENCINDARAIVSEQYLDQELGVLTSLEDEVIESIRDEKTLAMNVDAEDKRERTHPEIIADRIVDQIGSLRFSLALLTFVILWIGFCIASGWWTDNPTLVLAVISATFGTIAAIQGPVILMSQRRQAKRDRLRSENDYRVNLKAELEIQYLNEKIDRLIELQLQEIDTEFRAPAQAGS